MEKPVTLPGRHEKFWVKGGNSFFAFLWVASMKNSCRFMNALFILWRRPKLFMFLIALVQAFSLGELVLECCLQHWVGLGFLLIKFISLSQSFPLCSSQPVSGCKLIQYSQPMQNKRGNIRVNCMLDEWNCLFLHNMTHSFVPLRFSSYFKKQCPKSQWYCLHHFIYFKSIEHQSWQYHLLSAEARANSFAQYLASLFREML